MKWASRSIVPSLVQIMACRLAGAKPLSEPMLENVNWTTRNKFSKNLISVDFVNTDIFCSFFFSHLWVWKLLFKALPTKSLPHHLTDRLLHSLLMAVGLSLGRRDGLRLADITLLWLADLNISWNCLKPRLHSRGFRAGCTRLDDPCTTGSTTLPRPGTSVPGRERPWATAWRFSTGSEFLSWGKNQSRFFLSGAQTCLFVSWRPWLWHERDKASYNRDRAGEKSVCFWGRLL